MARVFILTQSRKGQTLVLNNRYQFVDGAMIVQDDEDAEKMRPILCDFFACVETSLEEYDNAIARKAQDKK